jgi:hypothetical protein
VVDLAHSTPCQRGYPLGSTVRARWYTSGAGPASATAVDPLHVWCAEVLELPDVCEQKQNILSCTIQHPSCPTAHNKHVAVVAAVK